MFVQDISECGDLDGYERGCNFIYRLMLMEMDACLCMIGLGVVVSLGQPGSGG